ncbi:MAG: FAD-dependent oxidoreductase [Leptolyngbya sp. PLA1]|nr:FAD-dependent oxidoreductase [Leptolyngbya sp. PLA1]
MGTRREFLSRGFSALAIGLLGLRRAAAFGRQPGCTETGALPLGVSFPVPLVPHNPPSVYFEGVPFHGAWLGDPFDAASIPFHRGERNFPGGLPPEPSEHVDVAIVGGGLSGLATAHLLRRHRPVVLELHDQFGGTSTGEEWRGTRFSMGGAYFITPDPGSSLERLYRQLGLPRLVRESPPSDDLAELEGEIAEGFWEGRGLPPEEQEAFRQYAALVAEYAERYPEIPLDPGADNAWILALDRITLRDHITSRMTVPVPPLLAAGIQAYCYSSFNAGWEEISAASGWNFIAAEEYGRWVLPGGNTGLIDALWSSLARVDAAAHRPNCPPSLLRGGCRVVDVRVEGPNRVLVTYRDRVEGWRSLTAKRVVMACPKHVAKHVLHDLESLDFEMRQAMGRVETNAYVVANVLLSRPITRDFYDMFLLRNGQFPPEFGDAESFSRITDAVRGDFTHAGPGRCRDTSVLTLYWPLPYASARFEVLADDGLERFARKAVGALDPILSICGATRADIRQVRLARWGHAMPIARPGFIAEGAPAVFRRGFMDHVFFVHQDNWALPAVETCLLEAIDVASRIGRRL